MVSIWLAYGFHMVFPWFSPDFPVDFGAGGGFDRPMEGRNDLDIDPGCLAFWMSLVLGFLGKSG